MEKLLSLIALNAAPMVTDLATTARGAPLFVMAGACPSVFAGMQTVVFTSMASPPNMPPPPPGSTLVDFWWLKPRKDDPSTLEEATLNRHSTGGHKNDPGASKKVYAPLASLFSKSGASADGKLRFGVVHTGGNGGGANGGGGGAPRAYIECVETGVRYYLCWVWLEDWSSPVAWKKFMKGSHAAGIRPRTSHTLSCARRSAPYSLLATAPC